jgi:uncharacterized protein
MLTLPIPDKIMNSIFDLTPKELHDMGITLLLMDLDNTLAKYHAISPSVSLRNWIDALKKAGIEPFIFSNTRGKGAENFGKALNVEYLNHAKKPNTAALNELLRKKGVKPENAAIIGDQIYTDILCGARAGIVTIAVRPIALVNPFHIIRYGAEMPFRCAYAKRLSKSKKR